MNKGQVVKDQVTGKKFALGATGIKGLVERATTYAQGQNRQVTLEPTTIPIGQAFTMKCTKCNSHFHMRASKAAEKYNEFKNECITHAMSCGGDIIPLR